MTVESETFITKT